MFSLTVAMLVSLYWINRCDLKLFSNNIYHTENLRSPESRLKEEEEERERLHLQLRWQKVFEHFPLNSFDLSEYPFKYFSNFILKSRVFLLGRPAQWHVTTARTYWPDLRKFRYVYSGLKLYFLSQIMFFLLDKNIKQYSFLEYDILSTKECWETCYIIYLIIFIEFTDDKIDEQIISLSYSQLKSKEFTILYGWN